MAMDDVSMTRGKQTMEVLSGFLHNAKRAVEQLCEGHTLASMQASKHRGPVATSAFGMLPVLEKRFSPHNAMAQQVAAGKPDQTQGWSYSSPSSAVNGRFSERKSDHCSDTNSASVRRLSESEMECAVGFFLSDIKKTVDAWCNRYRILAEGKAPSELMLQSLHTNMQVLDHLSFGPDADHDYSVVADLDDRDNEVLLPYAPGRQIMGRPFVKKVLATNRVVSRKPSNSRANRKRPRSSAHTPQGITGSTNTAHGLHLSQQEIASTQEPISNVECRKSENNGNLGNMPQNDSGIGASNAEGAIVKFGSFEAGKKSTADMESPVQTDELTIRPHHHKVEVVESPDWLPRGWITELKTRSTGGSAGCKDKYYYDPVSKRRCRSQKEVFCFLETGKLGRYKRKNPPANKLLGLDLEQQVSNSSEVQVTEKEEVSGVRSAPQPYSQESTSGALGIFPGTVQRGWGGGTFLPYRPGQTADLLYDSLTNLPRPGMDQYRYMDPGSSKSSGDKNLNTSRPWFLTNAEVSTGAPIDRIEVGNGQSFVRGRRGMESAAKRARKSTKQVVT